MLKPVDPGSKAERPVGELIHELIEEGKAYALAEIDWVKAIAARRARRSRCLLACSALPSSSRSRPSWRLPSAW